jgi:O-antigen/teichoic acid export membrane protein
MSTNAEQSLEIEPGSLAGSVAGPAPNLGGLDEPAPAARDDRLSGIRDVRRHVAGGMITNGAFQVGLLGLTAARGLAVAAFVSRSDYGLWGLIGLTLWTGLALKNQFGAGEKYVQQSEANQQHAFERAFTIEVIFSCVATVLAAAVVVGIALAAGEPRVLAPGFVLLLMIPAMVLQFPVATLYRRLEFRRQRALLAIDPVVSAVATIGLAIAGLGYWSFVLGTLAGSWLAAIVIAYSSPFPLRFRYDHGSLRQYIRFSAPLLVTAISILALFEVIYLVGTHAIGIAALGAFTLAGNLVQFTDQADTIVTETLYPAVCAVKDRPAVLSEIFVKSNRLSLMWAVPFGIGLTLFAPDLVRIAFGHSWLPAVPVLQILGAVTAVHHVGYNWAAFVKARSITWPIAAAAVATAAVTIAAAVPLMYADGVVGLAWAFVAGEVVSLVIRAAIMSRFFEGVRILSHLLRAFAPTLVAAVPVLAVRALSGGGRSVLGAVAELALYVIGTVLATVALERPLLREAMGYLLRRSPQLAHQAG